MTNKLDELSLTDLDRIALTDFYDLAHQKTSLSVHLVDNVPAFDVANSYNHCNTLLRFGAFVSLVENLGWLEHACDWDLYLHVTFRDDTPSLETNHGFSSFTVNETTVDFPDLDESDNADHVTNWAEITHTHAIDNIATIQLNR